jgi:hypothetical protein
MVVEREQLLPLVEEGFDLAEVSFPTVDGLGRVKVRTNFYSVPLRPGTKVQAKVYATAVEVWHERVCVARHERCYSRQQQRSSGILCVNGRPLREGMKAPPVLHGLGDIG